MKRLILAAGLLVATISSSLYAQSMGMRATIPFNFRIGNSTLPSGEYSVRHSAGVLFVTQLDGQHKGGMFLTVGEDHPAASTPKDTLLFKQYGDTYVLSSMWTRESGTAARIPLKKSLERELAKHTGLSGTATVALRSK